MSYYKQSTVSTHDLPYENVDVEKQSQDTTDTSRTEQTPTKNTTTSQPLSTTQVTDPEKQSPPALSANTNTTATTTALTPSDHSNSRSSSPHKDHDHDPDTATTTNKPPVNPWLDPSQFPDGGAKAWLAVGGAAACFFVSWGWINCIGVFQDYYMRVPLREYDPSTVAWIPSLEIFFMLATSPVAGYIYDNYGPRYLLVAGTFMHVFGLMMASISTQYYQFILSQGMCSAIGASLIFTPAVSCLSTWFFKKRGMAIGIAASGSSLGGVLFPIIVSHMINEVGFGWAMRTCAFLVLALMLFANFALTSRLPPQPRKFSFMAFVRPLSELPTILVTAASFFFYWGMFPVFSFITAVANERGMSLQLAQYLVSILNAGSVFGRTLPGILGDKIGRFNVMFLFCLLTSVLILALWIPATNNIGQLFFAPLFGFGSGAAIGLTPALVAQISPLKEIGTRTGLLFAIGSIGALTGSPIGGALISEDHGGFLYMMLFAGCVCFLGTALFFLARIKIGGWTLIKKV